MKLEIQRLNQRMGRIEDLLTELVARIAIPPSQPPQQASSSSTLQQQQADLVLKKRRSKSRQKGTAPSPPGQGSSPATSPDGGGDQDIGTPTPGSSTAQTPSAITTKRSLKDFL